MGVGGFTPINPPQNGLVVATTRSHSDKMVQMALDALKPQEIIKVGGAGYKVIKKHKIYKIFNRISA